MKRTPLFLLGGLLVLLALSLTGPPTRTASNDADQTVVLTDHNPLSLETHLTGVADPAITQNVLATELALRPAPIAYSRPENVSLQKNGNFDQFMLQPASANDVSTQKMRTPPARTVNSGAYFLC